MHTKNVHYLIAVLSLVSALSAGAQASNSPDSASGSAKSWETGAFQVRAGAARYGIGSLNSDLARSGRPTFGTGSATVGFNAYARFGRVLVGAGGETSIANRRVADGWITQLST